MNTSLKGEGAAVGRDEGEARVLQLNWGSRGGRGGQRRARRWRVEDASEVLGDLISNHVHQLVQS